MDRVSRRYQRVYVTMPVELVLNRWYWDETRRVRAELFQLGPQGCGLENTAHDFQKDQSVYLHVASAPNAVPLKICARIAWKRPNPNSTTWFYGLEFLWIRKDAGDEFYNPPIEKLNKALAPTGHLLMPSVS